jgi:hypothetical protein
MAHPPATRPQMLTANDLKQGDVLYWKGNGWVKAFDQGDVFADPAAANAALAQAQVFVTGNRVIAPYLFEVTRQADGSIRPVKEREIIRSLGPSIEPDIGGPHVSV